VTSTEQPVTESFFRRWIRILWLVPIVFVVAAAFGVASGIAEISSQRYVTLGLGNILLQTLTHDINNALQVGSRLLVPATFFCLAFMVYFRNFGRALRATIGAGILWIVMLLAIFYFVRVEVAEVATHNVPDFIRKTLTLDGFLGRHLVEKTAFIKVLRYLWDKPYSFIAVMTIALPFGVFFERVAAAAVLRWNLKPTRRKMTVFWTAVIALSFIVFLTNLVTYLVRHKSNYKGPNVLIVSIDTLRADRLGTYGSVTAQTPTLDQLGAQGAVFDNAYANSSWTLPSHAALFTGLTPTHLGIRKVEDRLGPGALSLAEVLKNFGYMTRAITSYILVSSAYGFEQGFDNFIYDKHFRAEDVVNRAGKFIRGIGKKKFFLFLHMFDPHWPYKPEAEYAKRFYYQMPTPDIIDLHNTEDYYEWAEKALRGSQEMIDFSFAMYDAEIAYVDTQLKRLFEMMAERKLLDNTIVVVLSDHGEEFREHGLMGHGLTLYEESIRIPMIVRFPKLVPAGSRLDLRVQIADVFNTVLSMAGIEQPKKESVGKDLLAEVFTRGSEDPGVILAETSMSGDVRYAVFEGDTKYLTPVELDLGKDVKVNRGPEVFDLEADPGERNDLSEARPMMLSRMKQVLAGELTEIEKTHGAQMKSGDSKALSSEEIDRLRSLGYIQ
jgi:arylsulfatase A-like enzyme